MSNPELTAPTGPPRQDSVAKWRRRSRTIHLLRIALPVAIGLIFAGLAGSVIYSAVQSQPSPAQDASQPIRLTNPRFVGRDDKGRAFVLTAQSATRDTQDYQKVFLDKPALVLDQDGPDPQHMTSKTGIYHEADRKLELMGGVHFAGVRAAFDTAASLFDTRTGELVGSGPIQGSGSLGEISAKSYGVYDKGDRMVFKGGVRTRLDMK